MNNVANLLINESVQHKEPNLEIEREVVEEENDPLEEETTVMWDFMLDFTNYEEDYVVEEL
jgi:hypothetical protein